MEWVREGMTGSLKGHVLEEACGCLEGTDNTLGHRSDAAGVENKIDTLF